MTARKSVQQKSTSRRNRSAGVGAVLASALCWGFGLVCVAPYYLAPQVFSPQLLGWISLVVTPLTTVLLTWLYLRWLRRPAAYGSAALLALALLGLHIPADLAFGLLIRPDLLAVLWPFALIWYACFATVPFLTAALIKRCLPAPHSQSSQLLQ